LCLDANAPAYSQGSIFWKSAYFLDHDPGVWTCPFQSKSRTVNRNLHIVDAYNMNGQYATKVSDKYPRTTD